MQKLAYKNSGLRVRSQLRGGELSVDTQQCFDMEYMKTTTLNIAGHKYTLHWARTCLVCDGVKSNCSDWKIYSVD